MSAITHRASTLTLLRQAQPAFQRTRRGLFDVGTRRFKCLTTAWKTYLRTTFKDGTSDLKIMAQATGGTRTGEKLMFVDSVNIDEEIGVTTIFSVNYK